MGYLKLKRSLFSRILFRQRMKIAVDLLTLYKVHDVLEIGAANCDSAEYLSGKFNVVALDRSAEMLKEAPVDVKTICADARNIPLPNGSFDAILMISTFKHIFRWGEVARECRRLLRANGKIIIIEPHYRIVKLAGRYGYFDLGNIANLWSPAETLKQFNTCGFVYGRSGRSGLFQYASVIKIEPTKKQT